MTLGLIAAVIAALSFGTASVLQAHAASGNSGSGHSGSGHSAESGSPSVADTVRAMLAPTFLAGVGLDLVGFVATAVAARTLPLFLSQPIISSNLVVTAVLAALVLKVALSRRDLTGIGIVVVSLVVLGLTSGSEGHDDPGAPLHWGLLIAALVLLAAGAAAVNLGGRTVAVGAALVSGVLFGLMAVGIRVVDGVSPFDIGALFTDPALYAIAIGGPGGFYLFTVALQTGGVAAASAALAVGETVVPGVVGALLLGDATRHGWGVVTVVAFVTAVVGAVIVATSDGVRAAV